LGGCGTLFLDYVNLKKQIRKRTRIMYKNTKKVISLQPTKKYTPFIGWFLNCKKSGVMAKKFILNFLIFSKPA